MSARDRILARLRAAQPAPTDAKALADLLAAGVLLGEPGGEDSLADRIASFRAAMTASHGEVHDATEANWPDLVAQLCAAKGIPRLLVGQNTPHGVRLAAANHPGLEFWAGALPGKPGNSKAEHREAAAWKERLFHHTPASLTQARGAIAETGSLVLWPDAREPRTLSLVPPIHFVLLPVAQIHRSFHGLLRKEGWGTATVLPTNALLVSGPSKTADIQQTLAYGAHGPKELIVLLVHPAPQSGDQR